MNRCCIEGASLARIEGQIGGSWIGQYRGCIEYLPCRIDVDSVGLPRLPEDELNIRDKDISIPGKISEKNGRPDITADSCRSRPFCLTLVAFAGILVFVTSLGERPALACPAVEFNHTYDDANDTLLVEHDGGDALRDGKFTVVVTDEETNETATVVWLQENATRTIHINDSIAITDREGNQPVQAPWVPFDLGTGDLVEVRWDVPEESECTSGTLSRFRIE
nr:type IV pilin N-terminal domain-containing protein [Halapricum sp. CBA1109]